MRAGEAERRSEERIDVDENERRAAGFWAVCSVLIVVFSAAAAPSSKLMQPGGVVFLVAFLVVNLTYAARLAVGPSRSDLEQLGAASLATAVLGVQQYLAGSLPMLAVLLPLYVLGAVAVLEHAKRLMYLPVVMMTALSPLLYAHIDARSVTVQLTLTLVLVMEMALLGDYGDRLRKQRRQLIEAEALSSRRAVTDELTGLMNRRALVDQISPLASTGTEMTVVYCDLDGFKPFNDHFGHSAGDALLRRLADALTAAAGSHGTAYRVGGDEFCVLLDGRLPPDAPLVISVVNSLTENGPGYSVQCSYGIATTPGDAVDLAGALQVADQRMYLHKGRGWQLLDRGEASVPAASR